MSSAIFLLLTLSAPWAPAQEPSRRLAQQLDWDLSYEQVLKKNSLGPDAHLTQWLKDTERSFTHDFLACWKGERITAAVLFEMPVVPCGHQGLFGLYRTHDKALFAYAINKEPHKDTRICEITKACFDDTFKSLASWKQSQPGNRQKEYVGILNLYSARGSTQLLLTVNDLFETDSKPGRVWELLVKLLNSAG